MTTVGPDASSRLLELLASGPLLVFASLALLAAIALTAAWLEGAMRGHRRSHGRIVLALRISILALCAYMLAVVASAAGSASLGWLAAQVGQMLPFVAIERVASWEARRDRSRRPDGERRAPARARRRHEVLVGAGCLVALTMVAAFKLTGAVLVVLSGVALALWSRRGARRELAR